MHETMFLSMSFKEQLRVGSIAYAAVLQLLENILNIISKHTISEEYCLERATSYAVTSSNKIAIWLYIVIKIKFKL